MKRTSNDNKPIELPKPGEDRPNPIIPTELPPEPFPGSPVIHPDEPLSPAMPEIPKPDKK